MELRLARRAVAVAAVLGASVGLTLALGAPAQADTPVVTLEQPAPAAVAPAGTTGTADTVQPYFDFRTTGPLDNVEATLTIDATQLATIAHVTFSDNCTVTQYVATCDEWLYDPQGSSSTVGAGTQMTIEALPGATVGSAADYTVSGTSDGATIVGAQGSVEIGGPAYSQGQPKNLTGLAVGSVVTVPARFTNIGDRPADSTQVLLMASPGLGFTKHYANCEYSTDDSSTEVEEALCTIPGQVLPGERAAVSPAPRVRVESSAYYTYLDTMIAPTGDAGIRSTTASRQWTQGTGDELTLKVITPGTATDAPSGTVALAMTGEHSDYRSASLQADNTADFAVTGDSATAAQGDTVTMHFSMANNGPATIFYRSGDTMAVTASIPPGTHVVSSSSNCRRTSGSAYTCYGASIITPAGTVADFSITLQVDQVIPGAQGSVAMAWSPDGSYRPPFDTDASDDSAALTLN
ncbi:hypothetical protein [Actinacidiphila yeochonensis]|uniref:hypothetical protein n=1 Tax=Actinacidiphila yeochonensis TaxID=89050 RepID=UPI0012FF37B0|nr:hypothetical protein [Actinacidiphila yeochonensis]